MSEITVVSGDTKDKVKITLKRGARGGYSWEIEVRGEEEKDISPRVTAINAAYLKMYGKIPKTTVGE